MEYTIQQLSAPWKELQFSIVDRDDHAFGISADGGFYMEIELFQPRYFEKNQSLIILNDYDGEAGILMARVNHCELLNMMKELRNCFSDDFEGDPVLSEKAIFEKYHIEDHSDPKWVSDDQ